MSLQDLGLLVGRNDAQTVVSDIKQGNSMSLHEVKLRERAGPDCGLVQQACIGSVYWKVAAPLPLAPRG